MYIVCFSRFLPVTIASCNHCFDEIEVSLAVIDFKSICRNYCI